MSLKAWLSPIKCAPVSFCHFLYKSARKNDSEFSFYIWHNYDYATGSDCKAAFNAIEYRQDETNIMQTSPTYFPSGVYHPPIFPFHSNPDIPLNGDKSCVKMIQLTFSKKDTVNFRFPSSIKIIQKTVRKTVTGVFLKCIKIGLNGVPQTEHRENLH